MRSIILVAHNIRSIHNVGSLLRTCDGFGVESIVFSGYTPYPELPHDTRLPHISRKLTETIHKTALGAEQTVTFSYSDSILSTIDECKRQGRTVVALEQSPTSTTLQSYLPPEKIVLIIGEEVEGVSSEILDRCDMIIEIPMYGTKESFNVSVAAGIALYQLRVA